MISQNQKKSNTFHYYHHKFITVDSFSVSTKSIVRSLPLYLIHMPIITHTYIFSFLNLSWNTSLLPLPKRITLRIKLIMFPCYIKALSAPPPPHSSSYFFSLVLGWKDTFCKYTTENCVCVYGFWTRMLEEWGMDGRWENMSWCSVWPLKLAVH